jgi:hypothetical protein
MRFEVKNHNLHHCMNIVRFRVLTASSSPSLTIGPAKRLPCPTYFFIKSNFFPRGLLIALMMEAVSTS